jgi:hypothetical protein
MSTRRTPQQDVDADYDEHAAAVSDAKDQRHGFDCPGCAWPEAHYHPIDWDEACFYTSGRVDIEALGLAEGMRVELVSEFTDAAGNLEERRAEDFLIVPYSTPVGNAASYQPETNPLVPLEHTAKKSNTPVSKAVVVRLEAAGQWAG